MINLDGQKIAKIKRGELIGLVSLCVAAAGAIFFIVTYIVARVQDSEALKITSFVVSPILIAVGASVSALFNLKYGKLSEQLIRQYIVDSCVENPALLHPERDTLTFYISVEDCKFCVKANGYKDGLTLDFSAFKKLSPFRKSAIYSEIGTRLTVTFCRLFERGAKYKEVGYTADFKGKKKKLVPVITDGLPDRKSFKIYLKNK